ncbi:MAG: hypothetical protein SF028_02260 [Candidatus Sumerlaeia bacterium]|nr:hypothetical protein [Candidatus Sumerlaeia bacterium]
MKKFLKALAVGAAVAILAVGTVTGLIDWGRLGMIARGHFSNVKHATGAVDLKPSGPPSAAPEALKAAHACRENLRRIRTAKEAVRKRLGYEVQHVPEAAVLEAMGVRALPKCPSGGTYIIGSLQESPRCTVGAGGKTDPGLYHALPD